MSGLSSTISSRVAGTTRTNAPTFKEFPGHCKISFNMEQGSVLVQAFWEYQWLPSNEWTYAEKLKFHEDVDQVIWQHMSGKAKMSVYGDSAFASKWNYRAGSKHRVPINFDIKWVRSGGHYPIKVSKTDGLLKGCRDEYVQPLWSDLTDHAHLHADSNEMTYHNLVNRTNPLLGMTKGTEEYKRNEPVYCCYDEFLPEVKYDYLLSDLRARQVTTVHEACHAILLADDEYKCDSKYLSDIHSMMHHGMELRQRHFDSILSYINQVDPSVSGVQDSGTNFYNLSVNG